jgi:broad specificity phosphatase PhoE
VLYVLRHGRTAANASGLLLGRLDPPLDDLGRAQAAAAALPLAGRVDRVISSPLLRARETAAAFGVDVEIDERWIELDYGDWDGRPATDVAPQEWAAWRLALDYSPPGGESLHQLGARVRAACLDVGADAQDGNVVVVTHVSPVKAALAWALGVGDEVAWRCFVATASFTRIGVDPSGPRLLAFNDTAHLDGLTARS